MYAIDMTRNRRIYYVNQRSCVVCYKIYALPALGRFRGISLHGVVVDDDVVSVVFDSSFIQNMNSESW